METTIIKSSLIDFISKNCNLSREEVISTPLFADDIVLNYVASLLQDSIETSQHNLTVAMTTKEEIIDFTELKELLTAYFPPFLNLGDAVFQQFFREVLIASINDGSSEGTVSMGTEAEGEEMEIKKITQVLKLLETKNENPTVPQKLPSSPPAQEALPSSASASEEKPPTLLLLMDMFPKNTKNELEGALILAKGNLESAVQLLLSEEEETKKLLKSFNCSSERSESSSKNNNKNNDLKEKMVARYGFYDKSEETKEFRPLLPKSEPKKLVRYRENQVVSTKGERYTEVAVDVNGVERPLRPYIYKRQQQQ